MGLKLKYLQNLKLSVDSLPAFVVPMLIVPHYIVLRSYYIKLLVAYAAIILLQLFCRK